MLVAKSDLLLDIHCPCSKFRNKQKRERRNRLGNQIKPDSTTMFPSRFTRSKDNERLYNENYGQNAEESKEVGGDAEESKEVGGDPEKNKVEKVEAFTHRERDGVCLSGF